MSRLQSIRTNELYKVDQHWRKNFGRKDCRFNIQNDVINNLCSNEAYPFEILDRVYLWLADYRIMREDGQDVNPYFIEQGIYYASRYSLIMGVYFGHLSKRRTPNIINILAQANLDLIGRPGSAFNLLDTADHYNRITATRYSETTQSLIKYLKQRQTRLRILAL